MFAAKGFSGKKVAVFGLARSGTAAIEALRLGGADVTGWDDSEVSRKKAVEQGIPLRDLDRIEFTELHSLVLSPGVPLTHPEPHWTVKKARAAGIEIIGDTEIFQRELIGSGAKLVAITGTNGKSTTTALTGHVFKVAGRDVQTGGNIGRAVFLLDQPKPGRIYVLELSSYQIDLMPGLKPQVGVLMNLTPDHLDRHGSMQHYADIKARMFVRQTQGDTAIVGVDDEWGERIAAAIPPGPRLVRISVERPLEEGVFSIDGVLHERQGGKDLNVVDLRSMRALRGRHNWQNACAAYAAGRALGLTRTEIERGMNSFPGLEHRMEEVGRIGEIVFINDSKATNADAAAKALASFEPIYWIAGGIPKAGGIDSLKPFFTRIVKVYLIGQAAEEFAYTIGGAIPVEISGTLEKAVAAATRDALKDRKRESAVLLSPACASFDHYPNFEVRGDAFRKYVAALPGVEMRQGG
ncbi:MAG TPA: UDP-N-acetylmuramoyl-L-alanine--D-glutamate ligase [Aestuariivirgaceae bacterium]|jgi:UDP-N-acetylmuramoylalanine--D-glutamate ligase